MPSRAELLAEAKKRGHKKYHALKKEDLEKLLSKPPPKPPRGVPRGMAKSQKAGFIRKEIAMGKLKKEGDRIVKAGGGTKPPAKAPAKAPASKPKAKELLEQVRDDRKGIVGEYFDQSFPDYIEMFLDGRGSEEKQLERASVRAMNYMDKQIKKAIKLGKITSLEEFNKIYDTKQKARDLFRDDDIYKAPAKAPKAKKI